MISPGHLDAPGGRTAALLESGFFLGREAAAPAGINSGAVGGVGGRGGQTLLPGCNSRDRPAPGWPAFQTPPGRTGSGSSDNRPSPQAASPGPSPVPARLGRRPVGINIPAGTGLGLSPPSAGASLPPGAAHPARPAGRQTDSPGAFSRWAGGKAAPDRCIGCHGILLPLHFPHCITGPLFQQTSLSLAIPGQI